MKSKPVSNPADPVVAVVPADNHAERIKALDAMASQHASLAVYCAAAAGAVMLAKQKMCKHGEFLPWLTTVRRGDGEIINQRTAYRYMDLATGISTRFKALPDDQKEALLAPAGGLTPNLTRRVKFGAQSVIQVLAALDPTKLESLHNSVASVIIREVTRQENLTQLYFDWGISRHPGKLGGYHPSTKPPETPAEIETRRTETARRDWCQVMSNLESLALKESGYKLLHHNEIEAIIGNLDEVSTLLKKYQREKSRHHE